MHSRDHGAADSSALQSSRFDQLSGIVARWVLKYRARAWFGRLRGAAVLAKLAHARGQRRGVCAPQQKFRGQDDILRTSLAFEPAGAIGKLHGRRFDRPLDSLAVKDASAHEVVRDRRTVRPAVVDY